MTRAVTCPSCKQQIGIADPPEVQENIMLRQQVEELKKVPKMPAFIPTYQCKGGTCGENHPNPLYTKLPKGKCRNCDQFSASKEGVCSWCNQNDIEEIDKDELKDRGIKLPGFD